MAWRRLVNATVICILFRNYVLSEEWGMSAQSDLTCVGPVTFKLTLPFLAPKGVEVAGIYGIN